MNRRAKFDAASFILGGEISYRTNKQTKIQTNKNAVAVAYEEINKKETHKIS